MKDYTAVQTVKVGGEYYAPGKPFQAEAKVGDSLVESGAAKAGGQAEGFEDSGELSAKELIEQIEQEDDREALEDLLESGEERVTVIAAAKKRLKELG